MAGWLLRRGVVAPLLPVVTALLVLLLIVAAAVSVVVCPAAAMARRTTPRWRVVRVLTMAVAYAFGECLCVLACLVLWLGSGCGRWMGARWSVTAHERLLQWFLGALLWLADPVFGFRLEVVEPVRHQEDLLLAEGDSPVIVLARHAGPGASFALVHLLMSRYHRRLQVVLKDTLRLDPAVDLLLSRTGCTWVSSGRTEGDRPAEGIRRAAAGLGPSQALLLFPEGADWTPVRHLAAVTRLRRRGLLREAQEALRMPHVLPPRPAGTVAALQGAPGVDVLIFTHTGHDELLDAGRAWQALPLCNPLQMAWWRVGHPALPGEDPEQVIAWLQAIWVDIDRWIDEQTSLAELQP